MNIEAAYRVLFTSSMGMRALLMLLSLIRCLLGPRISDRVLAINMIGTIALVMIGVMTAFLKEGFLADIAMIYALLSFLAVVVLCKVFTGVYRERKQEEEKLRKEMEEGAQ